MRKPGIPQVPKAGQERFRFDASLKESLETLMGRRADPIEPLPAGATLADVIAKINEILVRLQ